MRQVDTVEPWYKQAVFDHLTARWRDLFNISYDVLLLYDLTSTPSQLQTGQQA